GLVETVEAIAATVEMRDPYTAGHQRRVAELARAIAVELGMDEQLIHGIFLAGVVHDLGKIGIPAEILSYPGRFSDVQLAMVRQHAQIGFDILKDIHFPWPIAQMVLQHHERMDGSGYPQGLKGKDILPEARIMAVADVVEAMASHRPYRAGLGLDIALEEIEKNAGRLYDSKVAGACLRLFREQDYKIPS
ncbi:MAG TPA: HD-GYP domain-containing protein, partial [Mariprofundaceae bacterium]|nr:HD-GYP domain-containing protein [Mariprofundaceae bacterium]